MSDDKVIELFKETQLSQLDQFTTKLKLIVNNEPPVVDEPERTDPTQISLPFPVTEPLFVDRKVMKTRGKFPNNYPMGAIVHFTAGHSERGLANAIEAIDGGRENGYAYWCIAKDGTIVCGHDLSEWGYHAGLSFYPELGASVSQKLLGIEICNAGKVEPIKDDPDHFLTWFGTKIPKEEVDHVSAPRYGAEEPGYYQIYTVQQMQALVNLLCWLRKNSGGLFSFDYVLGHDEVATPKGRKNDPGGALFVGMDDFRTLLKDEAKQRGIT